MNKFICPYCGAGYLWDEVKTFPVWICDCGAIWDPDIKLFNISKTWLNFLKAQIVNNENC